MNNSQLSKLTDLVRGMKSRPPMYIGEDGSCYDIDNILLGFVLSCLSDRPIKDYWETNKKWKIKFYSKSNDGHDWAGEMRKKVEANDIDIYLQKQLDLIEKILFKKYDV